ncbi:glycerate kinase [Aeromicrobium panaciterrae]|uniref:glycerate kinase n=1 Tax=Aeromicrobium panaciterrae TaxID=363861 RepID=UPI0031E3CF6F
MTIQVLAAPDKFRGTATALEACRAISGAVRDAGYICVEQPLADGGEGTVEALGGANQVTMVQGPLNRQVAARWRLQDGIAVIEAAQACGLLQAGGAEGNDALRASTYGVGQLIAEAVDRGAGRIVVGLGGTASTDGGRGMMDAVQERIGDVFPVPVTACCDVATRFVDAAKVFGPQKGADQAAVRLLTVRLERLSAQYKTEFGIDVNSVRGSGAAGGLAGGLAALGGDLAPGLEVIGASVGLGGLVATADLVVTGEGRLDPSSFDGKVVGGLVAMTETRQTPTLVVAGAVDDRVQAMTLPRNVEYVDLTSSFGSERAYADTQRCIAEAVGAHLNKLSVTCKWD